MAKFATKSAPVRKTGFIKTNEVSDTQTYNGGVGYTRTPKSELFLFGVSSFNENQFYESANDGLNRMRGLVNTIVNEPDGVEWLGHFAKWLRSDANIRSMSIAIALETAHAMIREGIPGSRQIVSSVLQRPDEPAEAIAYWHAQYGRTIPSAVKRGIADATTRLYNESNIFKYDTNGKTIRYADVIQLVHPVPNGNKQSALFKFALDRRYNNDANVPEDLEIARNIMNVRNMSKEQLRHFVKTGNLPKGITWEYIASNIEGGMDAEAWEAVIPNMGYMALLRNLRNFQDAGISHKAMKSVLDRISDPDEVAKSRQLPFRFYSAYRENRSNLKIAAAIEDALNYSLSNIPQLDGTSLILVDMSGSMSFPMSAHSKIDRMDAAALFGFALALRADKADLIRFGSSDQRIKFKNGDSLLPMMRDNIIDMGGTRVASSIINNFHGQDRIIVLTDEQFDPFDIHRYGHYGYDYTSKQIGNTPMFIWNLAGYQPAGASNSNVFTAGGLNDASFNYIKMVESAGKANWPWA